VTQPRPTTDDDRLRMLRYTRPEQWPALSRLDLPAPAGERLLAETLDCAVDDVRRLLGRFTAAVRTAAAPLLGDPDVRAALDGSPFRAGERVVAVGDSLTADRVGWFEILRSVLALAGAGAELVNLGVSGNTTADALERFDLIEAARPTHVYLLLGTNDARRHGRRRTHRMVTATETRRNLRALTDLISGETGATIHLITPPPADQHRIDRFFGAGPVRWSAAELAELRELVRELDPDAVDLHAAAAPPASLEADGVHLSLAGQRAAAAAVALAAGVRHRSGGLAAGAAG
jgi:lysophospholipase L1-like esterase